MRYCTKREVQQDKCYLHPWWCRTVIQALDEPGLLLHEGKINFYFLNHLLFWIFVLTVSQISTQWIYPMKFLEPTPLWGSEVHQLTSPAHAHSASCQLSYCSFVDRLHNTKSQNTWGREKRPLMWTIDTKKRNFEEIETILGTKENV